MDIEPVEQEDGLMYLWVTVVGLIESNVDDTVKWIESLSRR